MAARPGAWRRVLAAERGPLLVLPVCFALGSTLWIFALADTSVANAVCLGSTTPIWAALLSPWVLGERSPPRIWLAAGAAVLGVWLTVLGDSLGLSLRPGDLAALANALLFAIQMIALRRYRQVDLIPAFALAALVTCLLDLALAGGFAVSAADGTVIGLMGVVHLVLPVFLLARGARDVPAVQIALISMTEILLSPAWVWLFLGEQPPVTTALGAGLIMAAVLVATVSPAGARTASAFPERR